MAKSGAASLTVCLATFFLFLYAPAGFAQTPPEAPAESKGQDQPEVVRVYTELVQTDVMVFDKQGRFVNGLKPQDFELRIDGKLKPIEFFEKITAGSINEESQIAAARGSLIQGNTNQPGSPTPLDRGRPVFFFVDDLHMDLAGLTTARKLITRFIDNEMGQNDEAAIASASGQIGFLQQLTNNKAVLRAALERLQVRAYSVRDFERPLMREYQALLITNYDRGLTDWFIDETIRINPGITREMAESMVTNRARLLLQQAGHITASTLTGLEGLIRSANKLPGRKLVFFISGGFFLDDRNSDTRLRLQRITSAAARSGVVIYSMDARGLVGSLIDASSEGQFDPSGRLQSANSGELLASQDGLNALAEDTGGKAVFNTNSLESGLGRALKETSTYYLLAWKPEREMPNASKFRRIEVKLVSKPDLIVQVRRGFFDREPDLVKATKPTKNDKGEKPKADQAQAKLPEIELRKVMLAPYPDRDIPVSLSLSYLNTPTKGSMLSTAMQAPNEFFSFAPVNGRQTAVVTIAGTVFDDRGRAGAAFNNRITIDAPSLEAAKEGPDLTYGYPVYLGPGLYQVRVGVRDEKTGRTGTAHDWIEIPSPGQLALSSLLLGARTQSKINDPSIVSTGATGSVDLNITHGFSANQFLRFVVFVYNAALSPADSKPDVAIQVQIVRDGQPVVTTAQKKLSTEGVTDPTRIPYAAEVSLAGLPAGQYLLRVSVVDRVAKRSASQQTHLEIQ
ncbi:MAG TPA: VWA domain-containing protein [Pyrinomonadaceae bacterium]